MATKPKAIPVTKSTLVAEDSTKASVKPTLRVQIAVNTHACDNDPQGKLWRVWDNYETIGEVMKTSHKKLEVAAACRDGVKYVYIREWFKDRDTNEWFPNYKKSVTVPVTYPMLDDQCKIVDTLTPFAELVNLMFEASEHLEDMWLYDDEHAVFIEKRPKKGNKNNDNPTED